VQHSFEGLDRPGGFARVELLRPLRSPEFRRLWAGQTVSLAGDGVFLIALAWAAYAVWNAPAALAVIGIAMTVPTIAFLLVGGAISDRVDRRLVMVGSDVARALVVGGITALSLAHALSFAALAALTAVYGAATAFFTPAFESSVPCIVPERDLAQANSLDQFVRPAALRLVGPALGGWLVSALGADIAFALDAATFVASAAAIASLRPIRSGGVAPVSTRAAIVDGLRFVRRHVWLWGTLLSAAVAYLAFLGPSEALLPYVVKNELHASASALGFVFAAGGVGAVGAAVVMAQVGQPKRDITFMYAVWTLATLAVAGYGLARSTAQLMLACLAFNALEVAGTVVWMTIKQRNVPRELLGRVSSLDWLISIGLLPLSFALVGPTVSVVGVKATLVGAALIGAAATLGALFLPGMRDLETPRRPSPPAGRVVRDHA
jgi:DHA3 family tetracycline resistance protein-like MFS transporter